MEYKFHYHTKKNWINDPNGLCYFNGEFHIYYQYNPKGKRWGNICWGHATTKDFIKYEEHEVAITNDMPYDYDGVFSGNSIVIDDTIYAYYTSVKAYKQTQSVATSKDGYHFTKCENNPIIDTHFEARDPYVFKDNDNLYMLLGTQDKILLFKANNPFDFEYVGVLVETEDFAECPNIVKIEDKYLLKYSSTLDRKDHFFLGNFINNKFEKEKEVFLPLPDNYYASQMFIHDGKVILIGWLIEDAQEGKEYTGLLSIPRIVYFENGVIKTKPVDEFEKHMFINTIVDNDIVEMF